MNWPDKNTLTDDPDMIIAQEHQTTESSIFPGDEGEIPLETRRALVQLLTGPSIDGKRHSRLWHSLIRDEKIIKKRLNELFLTLVIDTELQVAFTRQADAGQADIPTLLRRKQLTFIDSVLLLYLRQRLTQADSQGERPVTSIIEITDYLTLYKQNSSTDHAGFIKRVYASIEKIKKNNILIKIRGSDDRFEISPTLKLLLSAEDIVSLNQLYQQKRVSHD